MSMVKKMAMIIVMQNDLQAAVDFYKKLGLTLVFHVSDRWAEFKINGVQIGLCPTQETIQYNRTGIVFEIGDLEKFYETNKQELNFLDKPTQAAHGIMASIQDPSGNILDLYQPTPEKLKKAAGEEGCCASELSETDSCCQSEAASQSCC